MMNHSGGGEEVEPDLEDILERYTSFCMRVWSDGRLRVCEDRRLMEEVEREVFSREEETHTFTLLPFYTILPFNNLFTTHTSITPNITSITPNITSVLLLQRLCKAFEILELLCINLFLFPWKKEFKTLKKFTARFVYYIKAVLPPQSILHVLHHIGYDSETHSEFLLSQRADPQRAKAMGLELFLARWKCERLIQGMSQNSDAEGLQIIQNLRFSETLREEPEIHTASNGETHTHTFLFPSETSLTPPDQQKSGSESLEHKAFLSEDKSILEMQKDYPDLTFRQRPIFKNSSSKMKQTMKLDGEPSHAEAAPQPQSSGEQQPWVEASSHTPGFTHTADASVKDLGKMMDKLKDIPGDERLKCPVEETNQTVPIVCSLSHLSVFSTTSDPMQQNHNTTEPPQSFYIPTPVSGSATAPPAEHQENIQPSSRAGAQPDLHNALEIL